MSEIPRHEELGEGPPKGNLGVQRNASGLWTTTDDHLVEMTYACPAGLRKSQGFTATGTDLTLIDDNRVWHFRLRP